MAQFAVEESTKAKTPAPGMKLLTEQAPKSYKVNPKEILIQCLYRPTEPIHPAIIGASYTWVDQGAGWQRIMDPFGGWVHISRNWQSRLFLARPEFKYLLMIDSDEAVPWWAPFHLAEAMDQNDLQVLSGVVCGFTQERGLFACVAVKGGDGVARFPSLATTKTIPTKGIQEIHNAGTGLLMVRRDALEALWKAWEADHAFGQPFSIPEAEQDVAALQGALPRGEDVCFTDRCRKLGIKVNVDWAVKAGHQKPFLMAWPENQTTPLDPANWARLAWPGNTLGAPVQAPPAPISGKGRAKK